MTASANLPGKAEPSPDRIIIVIPVFNDWLSLRTLLTTLDGVVKNLDILTTILIVDDGSTEKGPVNADELSGLANIEEIFLARLTRNLGHQGAIAVGLSLIAAKFECGAVVVMDADGEDIPAYLGGLIEVWKRTGSVVVAARRKRTEGPVFIFFYYIYKMMFRIFIGRNISFGNYSLIPRDILSRLVHLPELWVHFAATLLRSPFPIEHFQADRGKRYEGRSKMNFISLATFGLSAYAVHADIMMVRVLVFTLAVAALTLAGLVSVTVREFSTGTPVSGWVANSIILFVLLLAQGFIVAFYSVLHYLSSKKQTPIIPAIHYQDYLLDVEHIKK